MDVSSQVTTNIPLSVKEGLFESVQQFAGQLLAGFLVII
jgi:hypothetical protein